MVENAVALGFFPIYQTLLNGTFPLPNASIFSPLDLIFPSSAKFGNVEKLKSVNHFTTLSLSSCLASNAITVCTKEHCSVGQLN